MKKLTYFLFVSLMIIQACKSKENKENSNSSSTSTEKKEEKKEEASSKKGYWTADHEQEFIKDCEGEIMRLKDTPDGKKIQAVGVNIEEFAQKSCKCALDKVENAYEDINEAEKDSKGITKIGEGCGRDVMMELMKK